MSSDAIKANSSLGKDFLTYLCYRSDERNGMFEIAGKGTLQVWLGDKIVLQDEADTPPNSVSFSGRDFTADDLKQAIKSGKKITEAQFKIDKDETSWSFTIRAQRLDIASLRMNTAQFQADDSEARFYSRMLVIEELNEILDELYYRFLHDITEKNWEAEGYKKFKEWVNK
jgi:recombination associated protein RdgC